MLIAYGFPPIYTWYEILWVDVIVMSDHMVHSTGFTVVFPFRYVLECAFSFSNVQPTVHVLGSFHQPCLE